MARCQQGQRGKTAPQEEPGREGQDGGYTYPSEDSLLLGPVQSRSHPHQSHFANIPQELNRSCGTSW